MIAEVRRFNRTMTQRVGALSDRYLARDRPLGASRVLWEIGTEGCEIRALRSRLELDSGQLRDRLQQAERELQDAGDDTERRRVAERDKLRWETFLEVASA